MPASRDIVRLSSESFSPEGAQIKVAIVVPARNEAATIGSVLRLIPDSTPSILYHVFVCDDASTDGTGDIAARLGASVVRHSTNLGIGAALSTGFSAARAWNPDAYVQMDADGQHDPARIPELLDPIFRNEADYVLGSRFLIDPNGMSAVRRVGVWFYSHLVSIIGGVVITDVTSGFRAFRPGVYSRVAVRSRRNWALEVTLAAALSRVRIAEVATPYLPRGGGSSQFDLRRLFVLYHYRALVQLLRAIATFEPGLPPPTSRRIIRAGPSLFRNEPSSNLVTSISREILARSQVDRLASTAVPLRVGPTGLLDDDFSP